MNLQHQIWELRNCKENLLSKRIQVKLYQNQGIEFMKRTKSNSQSFFKSAKLKHLLTTVTHQTIMDLGRHHNAKLKNKCMYGTKLRYQKCVMIKLLNTSAATVPVRIAHMLPITRER